MKKVFFAKILIIVLFSLLSVTIYASNSGTYQFEFSDYDVTIIFDDNSVFNNSEREYIANYIVYNDSNSDDVSTYAWCWLTGHDLKSEAVAEIQHKVTPDAPRCLRTIYEVITCTKCDHVETNTLSSVFIDCCPEESST